MAVESKKWQRVIPMGRDVDGVSHETLVDSSGRPIFTTDGSGLEVSGEIVALGRYQTGPASPSDQDDVPLRVDSHLSLHAAIFDSAGNYMGTEAFPFFVVDRLKTYEDTISIGLGGAVLSSSNPVPSSVADGANVAMGAVADAAVTAGAAGSISAKLRSISRDLIANIVLAAGSNLIGKVLAYHQTDAIYNSTTALTPKFAFANIAAGQTDSNIVTAVSSKIIRVLAAVFVAGATATTLTFNTKPAGAGSAISALFANGINGGAALAYNPLGWFQTASGEGLTVTTGAGSTTGIQVVYVEV